MTRDMELVRKILLAVEGHDGVVHGPDEIGLTCSAEVFYHHVKIMVQADFVDIYDMSSMGGEAYYVKGLTWKGHEFLDDIRSDTVWNKTKATVGEKAGTVSMAVLQEVAKGAAKALFGLP